MVQNMLVTAITPLQITDEITCWENRPFTGLWPESKHVKNTDIKRTIKKKSKRNRTAYTTDQLRALEKIFTETKYITSERRRVISEALNIGDKSVKIWFQNRRMKEKRESSESSSESSNETLYETSPQLPQEEVIYPYVHQANQDENHINGTTFQQYQVPSSYPNNFNTDQTLNLANTVDSDGMQCYNDTNVYPTQYYPYNEANVNYNDYTYYQYQQENSMCNNYWRSNSANPHCYY